MRTMTLTLLVIAVLAVLPTEALAADAAETTALDLGGGAKLDAVLVPAGEFMMGSPDTEKERQACEEPVHKVKITQAFYLGKYEVTNAQYRSFRPGHHSEYLDGDEQPALWVSWYDADAFCQWLAKKSGRLVRLPTEAEWEYACRAGTTTRFYTGDSVRGVMDSADLAKAACYGANSRGESQPAGKRVPNKFGLYDMHGNAWEWCADWFGSDYYKTSPAEDPKGPETGVAKVLRGGSYAYWTNHYCRSDHRYRFRPDAREPVTGLRVVVEVAVPKSIPEPKVVQPWPAPREIAPLTWIGPPMDTTTLKEGAVAKKFGGPAVAVPKSPAPKVDGKLDDAAWTKARTIVFRFLDGRAMPPTQKTVARLLCDDKSLYVAFDATDNEMARLTVSGEKRDDPVWQGDTVEIFLDPLNEQKAGGYCHIAINPAGVTMDTKNGDASWNPKLEVATSRSAAGWQVEAAIPFSELGLAADAIPTVWGMNLTRYRPDMATNKPKLGTLVPHSWPVDNPDLLRAAEDTGWAATLSDTSHVPTRFGHAMIGAGTKETPPPAKLFELIAREDFSDGTKGKFSKGAVEDGGYMGPGKHLRLKPADGATTFQVPLKNFRDVQLIAVLKGDGGQGAYWHTFTKLHESNKACARQVTTLTPDFTPIMPTFNYCHGGGRIDFTSHGVVDPYYAGFRKHLLWFSEPTIGRIAYAGPKYWAIVYTRVGQLQTQHPDNKLVNPDDDEIPGWFFHPSGNYDLLISDAVMFKGIDNEPPAKVANIKSKVEGDKVTLSWDKSADNTLTVWYRVTASNPMQLQPPVKTIAEVRELSVTLPGIKVNGMNVCVSAVDFFENESEPARVTIP